MNTVYLLLGSNLGKRESYLAQAIELLSKSVGKISAKSSVYNTMPWPEQKALKSEGNQDDFLNQAICIETILPANELLETILSIEVKLGRKRDKKWESRTIDIDILFYNSVIITTPSLTIPHPFLHERKFVLRPLAEIAENLVHPILNKSIKMLLSENTDNLSVNLFRNI